MLRRRSCLLTWGLVGIAFLSAGQAATQTDTAQVDVIQAKAESKGLTAELTFRARVTAIQPIQAVTIHWRYGGEALGGVVVSGQLGQDLAIGEWTEPVPLVSLCKGKFPPAYMARKWHITFTTGEKGTHGLEMELEFSYRGTVLKTLKEAGPDGGTVSIIVPHYRLAGGKEPTDPAFLAELTGLLEYARARSSFIQKLPWAEGPLPRKYAIAADLGGYGEGQGYGIRHCDKAVIEAELPVLRQMGVNALRTGPDYLQKLAEQQEGRGKDFCRARIGTSMGFPVPSYRKDRQDNDPEAGCPFGSKVAALSAAGVKRAVEQNLKVPLEEVWALTIDEIGSVFDQSAEGKKHMDTCPRCAEAFRQYVKSQGATPEDFGRSQWDDVKPAYDGGSGAMRYWSRRFNNYATAKLFTELKDAFDQANRRKQAALDAGQRDTAAARQPWIYSYALRGNTFLMAGHSLDFFDFYRHADNAFMYETSNTGKQIWQWDSYLCDVGRILQQEMGKRFGVLVKPHRGAPIQRALTAVSRGAKLLYWYTYGPDYYKGDSFADNLELVALAVKGGHLIGKTEDVLYGSTWALPAEVAIVKPRCSEFLGSNEAWENAKWVYTALAHAHIPVDPIDEVMLAQADLSKYKIIYLNGSHLPRSAAEKLDRYVRDGGTLWTSGWGCARDEADQPLTVLQEALGLAERAEPQVWYRISRYSAGPVPPLTDSRAIIAPVPPGALIEGSGPYAGSLMPVVGREVLTPGKDTQTLAKFADGGAAMTVHKHGKGQVYVVGFFPGLEYSATARGERFDMSKDFQASRRSYVAAPALALTRPVVDASVPAVEGVLLKNPATGKQAVTLMNWAYRTADAGEAGRSPGAVIAELKDLQVVIRGAGQVRKVASAMLGKELVITGGGQTVTVTLPQLQEGDVLLIE